MSQKNGREIFVIALLLGAYCGNDPPALPAKLASVSPRIEKAAEACLRFTVENTTLNRGMTPRAFLGDKESNRVELIPPGDLPTREGKACFDTSALHGGESYRFRIKNSAGAAQVNLEWKESDIKVWVRPRFSYVESGITKFSEVAVIRTLPACGTDAGTSVLQAIVGPWSGRESLFLRERRTLLTEPQSRLIRYNYVPMGMTGRLVAQPSCFGIATAESLYSVIDQTKWFEYQPNGSPQILRWTQLSPSTSPTDAKIMATPTLAGSTYFLGSASPTYFFLAQRPRLATDRAAIEICSEASCNSPFVNSMTNSDILGMAYFKASSWSSGWLAAIGQMSITLHSVKLPDNPAPPAELPHGLAGAQLGTNPIGMAIADIDQDGLHDLVFGSQGRLYWLPGIGTDGASTFAPTESVGLPLLMPDEETNAAVVLSSLAILNFAGDSQGSPDVVVTTADKAIGWRNMAVK